MTCLYSLISFRLAIDVVQFSILYNSSYIYIQVVACHWHHQSFLSLALSPPPPHPLNHALNPSSILYTLIYYSDTSRCLSTPHTLDTCMHHLINTYLPVQGIPQWKPIPSRKSQQS